MTMTVALGSEVRALTLAMLLSAVLPPGLCARSQKGHPLGLHCTIVSTEQGYTPGSQRRCWTSREIHPAIHLLPVLCKKGSTC